MAVWLSAIGCQLFVVVFPGRVATGGDPYGVRDKRFPHPPTRSPLPSSLTHRSSESERRSHAFAISQSRFTVAGEISNTSAVSSMVRPPK